MKPQKVLALCLLLVIISLISYGCCLKHDWKPATCESPKICNKCGKTEGEPLGHKWQEATCSNPKTCIKCGKTEGDLLEHQWEDATCVAPKTCKVCGKVEGDTIPHRPGEWKLVKEPKEGKKGLKISKCIICGSEIEENVEYSYFDLSFNTFIKEFNSKHIDEATELKSINNQCVLLRNGKEQAYINRSDMNIDTRKSVYTGEVFGEFNQIQVCIDDKGGKHIDDQMISRIIDIGAIVVAPLVHEDNEKDIVNQFIENLKITKDNNRFKEYELINGEYKYQLSIGIGSDCTTYKFSCETMYEGYAEVDKRNPVYTLGKIINLNMPLANVSACMKRIGSDYELELKTEDFNTVDFLEFMKHSTDNWGFNRSRVLDRYSKILEMYNDKWIEDNKVFLVMEGYGIKWTLICNYKEDDPAYVCLKVNKKNEFEAVLDIEIE